MDFPYFELPWLGNRSLIAAVATLHVLVNHSAAIGGSLLVVLAERHGLCSGDEAWERLARRLAFTFFLLTTTVGALSGVGIWFTAMVTAPQGIAAMLRIFFWAWFLEWFVFLAEVGMVLAYFLSWDAFRDRRRHLQLGWAYVGTSYLTLLVIVGILGAMLTPGAWVSDRSFWSAFFNPTYAPQVLVRTGLALALAAALGLTLAPWLAPPATRVAFGRLCARFFVAAAPLMALGGAWYLAVLPAHVKAQLPTAAATLAFSRWADQAAAVHLGVWVGLLALGVWGLRRARPWPLPLALATGVVLTLALGHFERVREFSRKPYLIPGYMYANGLRVADGPRLAREGMLPHTRWQGVKGVEAGREREAGRALFRLQCATCHTLQGPNALAPRVAGWTPAQVDSFVRVQHQVHPFMPPFLGTPAERRALAEFLASEATPSPRVARQPEVRP
ncbi:MAG: c-type cytochrome [Candidatus Sericytochromatia bacterium]|nr:c-type cytochrome [Candidatus Sericytochromatia bacterium]